jgi:hypothetical protein
LTRPIESMPKSNQPQEPQKLYYFKLKLFKMPDTYPTVDTVHAIDIWKIFISISKVLSMIVLKRRLNPQTKTAPVPTSLLPPAIVTFIQFGSAQRCLCPGTHLCLDLMLPSSLLLSSFSFYIDQPSPPAICTLWSQ